MRGGAAAKGGDDDIDDLRAIDLGGVAKLRNCVDLRRGLADAREGACYREQTRVLDTPGGLSCWSD